MVSWAHVNPLPTRRIGRFNRFAGHIRVTQTRERVAGAVLGIFIWVGQSKGQANFV